MTRGLVALAALALAVAAWGCGVLWPPSHPAGAVIWSDEFNGRAGSPPDARRWRHETGGHWGAGELQYYTRRRANAALDGRGHLVLTARQERYTGADGTTRDYTSARLSSEYRFSFAYGRIDARIRVAGGRGLISAFWALGDDMDEVGWPASGEFDVVEVLGSETGTAWGSLHGPDEYGEPVSLNATHSPGEALDGGFHVYSAIWSPRRIEFLVDGQSYAVRAPSDLPAGAWRFEHPFYLMLTLSVGGRWAGPPDDSTRFPARMTVDWIRVHRNPWTRCATVASARLRDRCP